MKGSFKRGVKRGMCRFLAALLILPMIFTITGCTPDTFTAGVNEVFARSSMSQAYTKIVESQIASVNELVEFGVITTAQADSLTGSIYAGYNAAMAAFQSASGAEGIDDAEAQRTHPVIASLLQASVWSSWNSYDSDSKFKNKTGVNCGYWGGGACTDKKDAFHHSSTCLYSYGQHNTVGAINASKYQNPPTKVDGFGFKELDVWEGEAMIKQIIDTYNATAGRVQIYTLNPARVNAGINFAQMHELIRQAQNEGNPELLYSNTNGFFKGTGEYYTFPSFEKLDVKDVYNTHKRDATGKLLTGDANRWYEEANSCTTAADSIKLYYKNLDTTKFKLGLGVGGTDADPNSPLSKGILIGNALFITQYDVAVLNGFTEVAPNNYAPVFTYAASALDDTTLDGKIADGSTTWKTRRTEMTGDASSGFSESIVEGSITDAVGVRDSLVMDVSTGSLLKKGTEGSKSSMAFMGLGTPEAMSSIWGVTGRPLMRIKDTPYVVFDKDVPDVDLKPMHAEGATGTALSTVEMVFSEDPVYEKKNGVWAATGEYKKTTYPQPIFVLAEYLELVFSPDVVADEAVVAYGRKVRLTNDVAEGKRCVLSSSAPAVAYVIGGGVNETAWNSQEKTFPAVYLTDFLDVDGIYTASGVLKNRDSADATGDSVVAVRLMSEHNAGHYLTGDSSAIRGDNLPQVAAGKGIECVVKFGSQIIAKADANASPTQTPLYGVLLFGGLFERGLFGTWINSASDTGLSSWAENAKLLGYPNYKLDGAIITENLRGNYVFELNRDGLLSLDLDTTVEISKQNAEDRRGYGVMVLRTVLLILGFVLIAYVLALLGAWALDVNLDFGINMLTKLTFGHLVAIRSIDEMPPPAPDGTTTYVDFKGLAVVCIALGATGVLLITLDPVSVIIRLLTGLNFLLNEIATLIFGTPIL